MLGFTFTLNAISQKQTFDLFTYTPPKSWTKEITKPLWTASP